MATLLMSMKAAEYCHPLDLAWLRRVVRTKMASMVLLLLRKPNCSGPSIPSLSTISVILWHIRAVIRRNRLEGTVIGRYWLGWRESPPYNINLVKQVKCKLTQFMTEIGDDIRRFHTSGALFFFYIRMKFIRMIGWKCPKN